MLTFLTFLISLSVIFYKLVFGKNFKVIKILFSFKPPTKQKLENSIECLNPSTNEILGYVPHTQDVEALIKKAKEAQKNYDLPFDGRIELLLSLKEFILSNISKLIEISVQDTGKTSIDAFLGEILTTLEKIDWIVLHGKSALKPEKRSCGLLTLHKVAQVEFIPRGVNVAIVSWNYPIHNILGPIISGLFTGNAVVVKPSPHAAYSCWYLEQMVRTWLSEHGLDQNLVQFIYGDVEEGRKVVCSPLVDKILFIGSTESGKNVMRAASDNLTTVVLELGGKDAAILFDDADISHAIPIIMRGTFQNAGQNCVGLERIIVHESLYDEFIDKITPLVKSLRLGRDVGAITMPNHCDYINTLVRDAEEKGATVLCGGKQAPSQHGTFFEPTLLIDVTPECQIHEKEVFGPVMVVMKFRNIKELEDIMDRCPFALGLSIFSKSNLISKNIKTGMLNYNDFAVNYLCQGLPFGGCRKSGFGTFAGIEGLRGECVSRAVTYDRMSFIKTTIPWILSYPLKKSSMDFCKSLMWTIYGNGTKRVKGLISLVSTLGVESPAL
jgi:acyl-CoA reductase-like NAD-dependent aldehyde dehydrogenase